MKAPIVRDKKKRQNLCKIEEKKNYLKSLKLNAKLHLNFYSKKELENFPKKNFKNRCIITGRGHSVNRDFKLSRHEFSLSFKNSRMLPGLRKASW